MSVMTPYRSAFGASRDGFAQLLHSEWTKFRTVRGWIIGMIVAVLVTGGFGVLGAGTSQSSCQQVGSGGTGPVRHGGACTPSFPLGPGGEPVTDSFYFVHQQLTGDGSITVRLASMTGLLSPPNSPAPNPTQPGLEEWAKAGIIIKSSLTQGSAYASMMVAAGHGVRMQWNYTGDTAGLSGAVGPANPRWLRLTRSGDVITGYDSADGTHWTEVGAVTLTGLPRTAQAGLLVTSPGENQESQSFGGGVSSGGGGPTQATATFDQVSGLSGTWAGEFIGGADASGLGGYHQAGGRFTVTGSGDIAPIPAGHGGSLDSAATIADYLLGTFLGLIALGVIAAMFMTAEYRRSLIRITLAASPRRGRVLAAKAVVIAAVSFVVGLAGSALAVLLGAAITHARGYYEYPVSGMTELKVIVGTGLFAAVAAVFALAVGAITRRGATAVVGVIVAIVLPYFLAVSAAVPLGAGDWLLRITPAAGFALQSAYPRYDQVTSIIYSPLSGYYPLSWWAGLLVLSAWTAAALGVAAYLLRRRDA